MVHAPDDNTPRAVNPGERKKQRTTAETSRFGERVRTSSSGGEITRRTNSVIQSDVVNRQRRHDEPQPTISYFEENNGGVVTTKRGRTKLPALNGRASSSQAGFQLQSVADVGIGFFFLPRQYLLRNKIINDSERIAKSPHIETNSDIPSYKGEDGISPEAFREAPLNENHCYDNSVHLIEQEDTKELVDQTPVAECGYAGDDESTNGVPWDQTKIKVQRKKFGIYPLHRIRIDGVPWMVVISSDEENEEEDAFRHTETLKKPRQSPSSKAPKPTSNIRAHMHSSSCAESEESEPMAKRQKYCIKKRKSIQKKRLEVDTTASEASDAESLYPL